MKFRIIASIVVIVVLIFVAVLIGANRQQVDADGNPVPQEQPQQ